MQTQERTRAELQARLDALDEPAPQHDPAAVRAKLKGYLQDWKKLLRGHVGQSQQVLRRLVNGRLVFTPTKDGYYEFAGTARCSRC